MSHHVDKSGNSTQPSRRLLYVAGIILLGGAVLGILYLAGRLSAPRQTPATHQTNNSYTKSVPSGPSQQSGEPSSSSVPDDKNSDVVNEGLLAPTGNFVSNHHPSLSNQPAGSGYLTSTCSTTPGASCQIEFTKDGLTKSLPVETTDAGGSAYWNNWRPQDIGLTEGSWTVAAVAKQGTQTRSANDALQLEVEP